MSRFENQRALSWLDEELERLGNDGHPRTEAALRVVRDDLLFEMSLSPRRARRGEPSRNRPE